MATLKENQEGLNQVVISKVKRLIENRASGIDSTFKRLYNESDISQDFIAPIGVNLRQNEYKPVLSFSASDRMIMNMNNQQFTLHDNAVSQIADKMNIPAKYLRELALGSDWKKKLCATILNEHSGWTQRTRVLIRAVGSEVRGVLSDSYKRLNSKSIISAFLEEVINQGAVPIDAFMSDTKIWCETILSQPVIVPTKLNGDIVLFAGVRFSTSDYGCGSLDIRSFLLNGVCLNGMVKKTVLKSVHLGARLPDNLNLSQQTYELDTKATVSAVRDLTKGLYSKETILKRAIEIQEAANIEVDFDKELKGLVQKNQLTSNECREVEKLLMNNNPDDGLAGGATLWKLTQGITAYARDLQPVRQRELHELSGLLIDRIK